MRVLPVLSLFFLLLNAGCAPDEPVVMPDPTPNPTEQEILAATFGTSIDLMALDDYAGQTVPDYVDRDNTAGNRITNAGATLGRVLFYDRALSTTGTISCASCHRQDRAFGDDALASEGVAGTTGRHSMRLVNARFGDEVAFFWDERATSLEEQTTQPIQDHVEMGFSGLDGNPDLPELLERLRNVDYYAPLFRAAFGDESISEARVQNALAQFIRSIQSFDARYDLGRAAVNNDNQPFPNFTEAENRGKQLFLARPQFAGGGNRVGGGLGCAGCHQPPEFSIDEDSGHNGVTGSIAGGQDLNNVRSPSLRDVFLPSGGDNGPFMHTGQFTTLDQVLNHYNRIPAPTPGLDNRLRPGGQPQRLNLTPQERADVLAFLRTLTGSSVYTEVRWADPFLR